MTVELPRDLAAERAVLNSMRASDTAIHQVTEMLGSTGKYFYDPANAVLYEALVQLNMRGITIDGQILQHHLSSTQSLVPGTTLLQLIGGPGKLADVFSEDPSPENVMEYANAVYGTHVQRQIIKTAGDLARIGTGDIPDHNQRLSMAESAVYGIREGNWGTGLESSTEATQQWLANLNRAHSDPSSAKGWHIGHPNLRNLIGRVEPGRQIIIAGRPGMGKTASAIQITLDLVLGGEPAMFTTYEQSSQELLRPVIGSMTDINQELLKEDNAHKLTSDQLQQVAMAAGAVDCAPLWWMDIGDPMHVKAMAQRVNAQAQAQFGKPLALVVVDYIGIMPVMPNSKAATRDQELGEITRFFKLMARDMGIMIMVLAQLNREVERRQNHRPILSDLRESGNIEQDADIVIFVNTPWNYLDDNARRREEAQFMPHYEPYEHIVAKWRGGRTGTAYGAWNKSTGKIISLDRR